MEKLREPGEIWLKGLLFFLALETIFSVPYRSVFLAVHSISLSWIAGISACLLAAVLYRARQPVLSALCSVTTPALKQERLNAGRWALLWLAIGLAVRLVYALALPISLKSDGLAYFSEAQALAQDHRYTGMFWPPGFPLLLAPFLALLGAHVWVTVLVALLLFAATYGVSLLLAKKLSGGTAVGRVACVLLALWPTWIMLTQVNCKENLLALLIVTTLTLYVMAGESLDQGNPAAWAGRTCGAGLLMGACALTQPGYILFPGVIFLAELLRRRGWLRAVATAALLGIAMLIAILPWTFRNFEHSQHMVLIATNGGSVFYRANNPRANGAYEAEGEQALPKDEFAADKEGYRAGKAWIRENPGKFAALAIRKQVVYLGDDGIGPYESMKRGLTPNAKVYGAAKLVCNLFWLAVWTLLLLGTGRLFQLRGLTWFGVLILPLLYQWWIDSVFESGSRHHVSYIPLLCVLCGLVLASRCKTMQGNL